MLLHDLDKPFPLRMQQFKLKCETPVLWDSEEGNCQGIMVVWCLKYTLGGNRGMSFIGAGLMFIQLLTSLQHYHNLWAASEIRRDKTADFASQIATAGWGPSSSLDLPGGPPLALQPPHHG